MPYDYDRSALKERLGAAERYAECGAILGQALAKLGFSDFNYGAPRYDGSILSSMDRAWIERYVAEGYFRSDKLVLEAAGRTSTFRTCDIFVDPPDTVRQREMESAIAQHPQGLVVPIHCPRVGFAVLAAYNGMSRAAFDAFDAEVRAPLTLLAHDFHDLACRHYAAGMRNDGTTALTEREREVLEWAAQGKTAVEIGEVLGLSTHTVNHHLAAVRRKLGAKSTAAAVALLLAGGWRMPQPPLSR